MIFLIFLENADFVKYSVSPRKKPLFFICWALGKLQKINKTSMKNLGKFAMGKRRPQNALKNGFGRVLGSIWEGVGTVWAVFWTLLGCFFGILNPNFCKHRSRMGSKRPFGSILDRFWGVLGGLWMDFGRFWEGSGKIFYVRTPALSREAPRSVPIRGGPPLAW